MEAFAPSKPRDVVNRLSKAMDCFFDGVKTDGSNISSDGTALYVVNYTSDTISKVRVSDFKVLQKIKACNEPIGITYEPINKRVWVACYKGAIKIFSESPSQ